MAISDYQIYLVDVIVFFANILDAFGSIIILVVSIKAVVEFFKNLVTPDYDIIRLNLIRGLALGLEFKIGSSILRTVAVNRISDVEILAAIILIRTFLVFVIRREITGFERDKQIAADTLEKQS